MREPRQTTGGFQPPPFTELTKYVLGGLFALYVIELTLRNVAGVPIDRLAWFQLGPAFAIWQPLTRYLIQGQGVLGVVIGLVVLYFFIPAIEQFFTRKVAIEAVIAGALGGTALVFALDVIGLVSGMTMGWGPLVLVLVVLFGLKLPDTPIRLYFLIPIPGKVLVWGTGLITLLLLLASLTMSSADSMGTWLGVVGWWYYRGPGARRRQLLQRADQIQSEIDRFTVLDGGRDQPRRDDDDVVH